MMHAPGQMGAGQAGGQGQMPQTGQPQPGQPGGVQQQQQQGMGMGGGMPGMGQPGMQQGQPTGQSPSVMRAPGQPMVGQQVAGQGASWKTWHSDADYEQRKQLIQHIFRLFTGKPRTLRQEFKDKLPDFVKRLEEALYRTAATKEEYWNINTLEQRLQNVARRMIARPGQTGQQQMQMQSLLQGVSGGQHGQQQPGQQQAGQPMGGMSNGQGNFQQGNFQQNNAGMMGQQIMQGQMGGNMGASQGMMGQMGQGGINPSMGMSGGYQQAQQMPQPQQMQQMQQLSQMNRASPSLPNNNNNFGNGMQQQPPNGNFGMQQQVGMNQMGGGMGGGVSNGQQMNGQMNPLRGAATREGNWNQPSDSPNMMQVNSNQLLPGGGRMTIGGNQMANNYQQEQNSMGVQQQQQPSPMMQNSQGGIMRTPTLQNTPNGGPMMNISPSMQAGQQQMMNNTSQAMMMNNQVQQGVGQMQQMPPGQQQNAMLLQQRQQQLLQQQRLQQQQQQQNGMQSIGQQPGMGMVGQQSGGMIPQQGMMNQSPGIPGQQQPGQQQQGQVPGQTGTQQQQVEALKKQQKWLLFLRHCIKCNAPEGKCTMWQQKCQHGKSLIAHIQNCKNDNCKVSQCGASKKLLKHHQKCQNAKCMVCGPVNNFVAQQRAQQLAQQGMPQPVPGMQQPPNSQMQNPQMQNPQMQPQMQPQQQMTPQMQAQRQQQIEMQKRLILQRQQQMQRQQMPQQQQQQQQLQAALRGSASQELKGGMMDTPGMIPTPGSSMQASQGMSMPTPGLVGQQGNQMQGSGGMMPNPGTMHIQAGGGMQQGILRGPAGLQQGQGPQGQGMMRQGAGMMIPNNPSGGMMPSSGGMMPTPQGSTGMMMQNNSGMMQGNSGMMQNNSGMMPVPGMMPNPGMGGSQMNQGSSMPPAKRPKIEPMPPTLAANVKMEVKPDPRAGMMLSAHHNQKQDVKPSGSGQPTSLVETFSKEQISTYLAKVKEETAQENLRAAKTKKVDDKHPPPPTDETACRVCHNVRKSFFEPPVLFCFKCDKKIKENHMYYHAQVRSHDPTLGNGQPKDFYWCPGCFQEVCKDKQRDFITIDGEDVAKNTIVKKKNDDIQEEGWVQCDSCDAWVHQICGLFNRLLNDEQNTHYVCPECLHKGLESGKRKPVTQRPTSMLTAKDLPATKLSAFLEGHLAKVLGIERAERAKLTGKPLEETPAVEGLTVRVVNNVVKKCETKPHFYETFKDRNYPQEFQYRQKVILLWQTLDGVDLCLYCMYTQEYGDDNPMPNRRVSYLSYLDSVKYMKPEGITAAGRNVALRTYVYHELLIGYLDYLRSRGFHQMLIWACPPSQGDDYILYAHPKTQKNPALPKLREWYFKMLRKAFESSIVKRVSNLYDTYFEGGKDHRLERVSAVDLPYFEGDYWPGVAEVMLKTIDEEKKAAATGTKKAQTKKGSRSKMSKGKIANVGGATTDEQLMTKLGDAISGAACNKEDLMVVHLQHVCCICRTCIHNGTRYYSDSPFGSGSERRFEGIKLDSSTSNGGMSGFELCDNCYQSEIARSVAQGGPSSTRNRSLPGGISVHDLKSEHIPELPATIEESDGDIECEIFNTRQQFLSLCQGNHYQFDTTRRTRHSSMMVLYHLHNPSAPAFAGTCNVCSAEIEPGDGYRCSTCDDFDMCKNCQARGVYHEHPLVRQTAASAKSSAERKRAVQVQVHQTLELLKHSSVCTNPVCPEHKCNTMKKVIEHMKAIAQLREPHDCKHCKQMAKILKYHASFCKNNNCTVYMCRDLKDAMRRVAQRQEQQRAVAYQSMLAEQQRRAAEAGGTAP